MKTIGIAAHSAEGGALCFLTACHEGEAELGPHLHPNIVLSILPMGWSLSGWESGDHTVVAEHLARGVQQVTDAGADFYVCPDNTAHIVLEQIADELPIPGLHIADVVCAEIASGGWERVAVLGTRWTMTGPVYARALERRGLAMLVPGERTRERINAVIFDELCQGVFTTETKDLFLGAIAEVRADGAECVVLGCTEIPLIVTAEDSPLPILDSTRLLARAAVRRALADPPITIESGWLSV